MSLDQRVSDALVLQQAATACERPDDEVFVEVVGTGYHLRRTRAEAGVAIARFPETYKMADGPDGIDDEREPWELYNDDGEIIDTNGSLKDPELSDEDRARIAEYRASTTEDERRALRKKLLALCRR